MGTRFAASEESLASEAYKALLVSETMADVVLTDRISGLPATFLRGSIRSEEHTSELQSLMRISYAVFCLKKKIFFILLSSFFYFIFFFFFFFLLLSSILFIF